MEPSPPTKPSESEELSSRQSGPQNSPLADAERIRLKRLAKLQTRNSDHAAGPSNSTVAIAAPKDTGKKVSYIKQISNMPQNKGNQDVTLKKPITSSQKLQTSTKSFEDWQNDAISKVLEITLDKLAAEKDGSPLIYLNGLVAELKEENPADASFPFRLSQELLDRALVARLSIDPREMSDDDETLMAVNKLPKIPMFDYLLGCWKRASEIKRNLVSRAKSLDPSVINQRTGLMDQLKGLLVSYSGLILQMPDMFPQIEMSIPLGPQQIVPRFLFETDTPEGLPLDFIQELVVRFEHDGFEEVFSPIVLGLGEHMRKKNILEDFRPPLRAIMILTEIKPFAAMLPTLARWNPPHLTARVLEVASLLGPFCRISVFPMEEPSITETYFSNPLERSQRDVDSAIASIRGTLQRVQDTLFNIFNNIVRSPSPAAREAVLDYWATIIKINEKRAQMQVDPMTVGTDGFLLNLTSILVKFAQPFMDAKYSKINRIDIDYFRKSQRIDITQETKISATQQESDEYYRDRFENGQNFISEIFFITVAMHHYGLMHSFAKYNNFVRDLNELQKQYERAKAEQPTWASSSTNLINEAMLERMKIQLEKMMSQKLAFESQLLDPHLLTHSLQFYNLVMTWIVRIVDPNMKYPWEPIHLPLPSTPSPSFAMLPEYFIEDITEFFLFISRWNPMVIVQNSRDELVTFIITFLRSSSYIKNPYLKAKLVEILFYFTLPFRGQNEGGLGALLNTHPLSLNHLMPALMSFYVEVEQTGTHSQFYDKFNIRYNISQIFKSIWDNSVHRERLKEESQKTESFVKFANLMMNDATYLLDESLTKLAEIRNIQGEMDDMTEWENRTQQVRQEREGLLRSLERQATSYMTLGDETVKMLKSMTKEIVEPFITPQIVDRLAAMLNYNLMSLVGPKCTELKVKNPEKYRFSPRDLLSDILDVYLHLCQQQEFIHAVARDGRSYRKELFLKAAKIMDKFSRKNEAELKKLDIFVNRVEEMVKLEAEGEEELGDIPEEFLDPLMYHIMEDPVTLPDSQVTIDRSTIATHLLSDATDPFNRKPLSIDQVIPNIELKERIAAFKQEKKQKRNN